MTNFLRMLRDESGASAAEYALILAIVGTLIAAAAVGLGGAISDAMGDAADCINNPPADASGTCGDGGGGSGGSGGSGGA